MGHAVGVGIRRAVSQSGEADLSAAVSCLPAGVRERLVAALPANAPEASAPSCRMRVFHVNDVYLLDNFAVLRSCIEALSQGFPRSNVLTTLAGDFVAPSLLSSIDHGRGMVAAMNAAGVDCVSFGNHECDIPHVSLLQRIGESKFTWLNSNMRSFSADEPLPRSCPDNMVVNLEGGRCVALVGLCCGGGKDAPLYREGAFNGHAARITPVLEAAEGAVARGRAAAECVDAVIPLTHQDIADDRILAQKGLFPVILGGHDHGVFMEEVGGVPICKAGEDAFSVAVVDLEWAAGAPRGAPTTVRTRLVPLAQPSRHKGPPLELAHKPCAATAAVVERLQAPAEELKRATLAVFDNEKELLTSVGVRAGECTMASRIASGFRAFYKADGAVVNAGAVRGNRDYADGVVTFAHLAAECPFPSEQILVRLDGAALSDAVRESRRPWLGGEGDRGQPGVSAMALHGDEGMRMDAATGAVVEVRGAPLVRDRLYSVVVDSYLMKANGALRAYAERFPERVPPDDSGQPALPILVRYFCDQVWQSPVDLDGDGKISANELKEFFRKADVSGDGMIDTDEMLAVMHRFLPKLPASAVVAKQCLSYADADKNGKVSWQELVDFMIVEAAGHVG